MLSFWNSSGDLSKFIKEQLMLRQKIHRMNGCFANGKNIGLSYKGINYSYAKGNRCNGVTGNNNSLFCTKYNMRRENSKKICNYFNHTV